MRRNRQHIYIVRLDVYGNMPRCLHRVGVEHNACRFADFAYFTNRLNCAYLVVGIHNCDKRGIGTDSLRDLFRRNQTVRVHVEICHFEALFFKFFQSVQYGVMLESGGNNVFFTLFQAVERRRTDTLVVRFASAGSKINFFGFGIYALCKARPCVLQSLFCNLSYRVQ